MNILTPTRLRTLAWCLLLGFAAYGAYVLGADISRAAARISDISAASVLVLLSATAVNAGLRTARWSLYLRATGHTLPSSAVVMTYLAGFAFTVSPGKAGEAGRALLLKPYGVRYAGTAGLCLAERFLDVVIVAGLGSMIATHFPGGLWLAAGTWAVLAIAYAALRAPSLALRLLSRAAEIAHTGTRRVTRGLVETLRVGGSMLGGPLLIWGALLGLLGWGAEATGVWLLAAAFGLQASWDLIAGIYAASLLAGAASFLPGGVVGTEAAMAALLIATGVDTNTAIAVTLVARTGTLGFSMMIGLGALGWVRADPVRSKL